MAHIRNLIFKIGFVAFVIACSLPSVAMANGLQSSTEAIIQAIQYMPIIISGIAYLHGGATVLAGANKLKQHAEDPTKTPMGQGISRIVLGGTISSLPTFMGWLQSSLGVGGGHFSFERMSLIR